MKSLIALLAITMFWISCSDTDHNCPIKGIEDLYGTWHQDIDINNGYPENVYYTFSKNGVLVESEEGELLPGLVVSARPSGSTRPPVYQDLECRIVWIDEDITSRHVQLIWEFVSYEGNELTVDIKDGFKDTIIYSNLTLVKID